MSKLAASPLLFLFSIFSLSLSKLMDKIHKKYLLPNYIPTILFSPLYIIIFFRHLLVPVVGDYNHVYNPIETIFLYCGSSENITSLDGPRTWIGDIKSEHFLLHQSKNNASTTAKPNQQPRSVEKIPYMMARLSHSQFSYTFNLTPGQKFIRLYFYETSYQNFDRSKAFFSVKAGSFTLLSNFSTSLAANDSHQDFILKEFCVNVQENQNLNITFTPSQDYKDSYAFINGIEIVSMPLNLYYTTTEYPFVGQTAGRSYNLSNNNALETVYRVNVGGSFISAGEDTGMYRTWTDDVSYLTEAYPSALPVNLSLQPSFGKIPNYSAPVVVYQTARTMGTDIKANEKHRLTWEFPVDSAFTYLVRLHFCEFQPEITVTGNRKFEIYIANQTAEKQADVIGWAGGSGVPVYEDYAVLMGSKANQKKQNLSIALHPALAYMTNYSDAILNGVEIFKVDSSGSLAGPNPDPRITPTTVALPTSGNNRSNNHKIIIAVVVGVVSSFVTVSVVLLSFTTLSKSTKSNISSLPLDLCRHFSLSEMKAATNNFDKVFIIGVGGFGNVYKGFIHGASGSVTTQVAIKRLNPGSQQGAHEFKTEIDMLSQLRHLHLVSLIGYCNDAGEMILVYDYMPRGTLRDHLYDSDNPSLSWNQRLQICIGASHGLNYLHTGAKQVIIHRDVKTTNILLDENWVAKVSDFGLSKVGPTATTSKAHVSTVVKGSVGYLDPEYMRLQRLTEKSDVYSFGVVLCEVLCARAPIIRTVDNIHKKQGNLARWARQCYDQNGTLDHIVDPVLKGMIAPQCLKKFCEVAMSCLNDEGIKRPSMSDVVWGLEFALQLQQEYDELGGGAGNGVCVPHLDDNDDDQTMINIYASDYEQFFFVVDNIY